MKKCIKQAMCFSLCAFSLCSCNVKKQPAESTSSQNTSTKEHNLKEDLNLAVKNYVKNTFGFADNPVYGKMTIHTENTGSGQSKTYKEHFNDDSNGGAVFYKMVDTDENSNGLICAYLSEEDNHGILFKVNYDYDYTTPTKGSTSFSIIQPSLDVFQKCCYVIIKDSYLTTISLDEEIAPTDDGNTYTETLTTYKMTGSSLDKEYSITRTLESTTSHDTKSFEIDTDSERVFYASGYNNFTVDSGEILSTQQEFCQQANALLQGSSLDCISYDKTSWNNRWFGLDIDESGIGTNMVKVDYSCSEPSIDANNDTVIDITVNTNAEKRQLAQGQILEDVDDSPVYYAQPGTSTTSQDPVPDNLPQSINPDDLQNLASFDIDGFWYTSDEHYVYNIYTQHPDAGFGTLYYADLKNSSDAKPGQVKQTSSYSALLNPMEDKGFSTEVFAAGNELVSEDFTLQKVDSSVVSSLIGTWSNNDLTYTFDEHGTYTLKTSHNSYWGYYFLIGNNEIVLGRYSSNLKVREYQITGNTLTIDNSTPFTKQ